MSIVASELASDLATVVEADNNGKWELVKFLLAIPATKKLLKIYNEFGRTPVVEAAYNGKWELVKVLIENGAVTKELLRYQDEKGNSLLSIAVQKRDMRGMEFLLSLYEGNKLADIKNKDGLTPGLLALSLGHLDIAKQFFKSDEIQEIVLKYREGKNKKNSLLDRVVKAGHFNVVQFILFMSGSRELLDLPNENGLTPTMEALIHGQKEIYRELINSGAHFDLKAFLEYRDEHGQTVLHLAFRQNPRSIDCVLSLPGGKTLLTVRETSSFKNTPLDELSYKDKNLCGWAKALIKCGVETSLILEGSHWLRGATLEDRLHQTNSLLSKVLFLKNCELSTIQDILSIPGAKKLLTKPSGNGAVPIVQAAINNRWEIVKFMASNGANSKDLISYRNSSNNNSILSDIMWFDAAKHSLNAFRAKVLTGVQYILSLPGSKELLHKKNRGNETPILEAAIKNLWSVVKFLIENGADTRVLIDYLTPRDDSLLGILFANRSYCSDTSLALQILFSIPGGKNLLKISNKNGTTPIMIAASKGNWQHLQFMLQHLPDFEVKTLLAYRRISNSLIENAIFFKDEEGLQFLLSIPGARNYLRELEKDSSRFPILLNAIFNGSKKIVDILIQHGVDQNIITQYRNSEQNSILHMAIIQGLSLSIVRFILSFKEAKELLSIVNQFGRTPIMEAAFLGYGKIVDALSAAGSKLESDALLKYRDEEGNSLLDRFIADGNPEGVKFILSLPSGKTFINKLSKNGYPLENVVRNSRAAFKIFELLISNGANVEVLSSNPQRFEYGIGKGVSKEISELFKGAFRLLIAAKHRTSTLSLSEIPFCYRDLCFDITLLTRSILLNICGSEGNTLSHLCVLSGNGSLFMELIEEGADLEIRNNNGLTPLELAEKLPDENRKAIVLSAYNQAIANNALHDNDVERSAKYFDEALKITSKILEPKGRTDNIMSICSKIENVPKVLAILKIEKIMDAYQLVLQDSYRAEEAHFKLGRLYSLAFSVSHQSKHEKEAFVHLSQAGKSEEAVLLRKKLTSSILGLDQFGKTFDITVPEESYALLKLLSLKNDKTQVVKPGSTAEPGTASSSEVVAFSTSGKTVLGLDEDSDEEEIEDSDDGKARRISSRPFR